MADRRWNPWRALRSRPELTFARAALPSILGGAVTARWADGSAVIVIDRDLTRRHRAVALAHELVHLERGGGAALEGMPTSWDDVVVRDEMQVDREVARRLLPLGELRLFVLARMIDEQPTTALDIAEEFDVTETLAAVALQLL